jgi:hypothetical protein
MYYTQVSHMRLTDTHVSHAALVAPSYYVGSVVAGGGIPYLGYAVLRPPRHGYSALRPP